MLRRLTFTLSGFGRRRIDSVVDITTPISGVRNPLADVVDEIVDRRYDDKLWASFVRPCLLVIILTTSIVCLMPVTEPTFLLSKSTYARAFYVDVYSNVC